MILDTEGIRAPEFAGQVHSDARDNKMATMSIIPSDASIMMTVGDDDSAVKDILPIVLRIEGLSECSDHFRSKIVTSDFRFNPLQELMSLRQLQKSRESLSNHKWLFYIKLTMRIVKALIQLSVNEWLWLSHLVWFSNYTIVTKLWANFLAGRATIRFGSLQSFSSK